MCLVPNVRNPILLKDEIPVKPRKHDRYINIDRLLNKYPSLNWITECYEEHELGDSTRILGYNGFYIGRIFRIYRVNG